MSGKDRNQENHVMEYQGVQVNIGEILHIDEENLNNEFAHQAAVYGWIAQLVADSDNDAARAKHKVEIAEADAYDYWRSELERSGKVTEAMVRAAVVVDESYVSAKEKEQKLRYHHRKLRYILDSLKMRADMLISLGAHLRSERDMTGMHITDPTKSLKRK